MLPDKLLFSVSDLAGLSDQQLIETLKKHWGYTPDQPLYVLGRLKEIPTSNGGSFFILEDLHSVHDGADLLYPLDIPDIRHTVFVGSVKDTGFESGQWIKAQVTLSPEKERIKHENPFALKTMDGGLELLEALPEGVEETEYVIDGKTHIEKWVLDFYLEKNRKVINEESSALRARLQQQQLAEEARLKKIKTDADALENQISEKDLILEKTNESLARIQKLKSTAQAEFAQQKTFFIQKQKEMEHQLTKLNKFIEKKARMLVNLDLVAQEDVDAMLGRTSSVNDGAGHDFVDVFDADPSKAVSYIQAFMKNKHIVYRRKILEDFYALVTTNDLVILAGDSGSGKTNLVKSFAEAVGGKSIIIPVKPNWTSAEDLLGYYNPLEQKYLTTPFLDALFEAARNPSIPYFICLDEMNLARVEYYFADFLSLLEDRTKAPQIHLYSDSETENLISEVRNFLSLIDDAKSKLEKADLASFLDLLRDEELNAKLHELCGFREGDSLLKYHAQLRKIMSSYLNTPSKFEFPANVRIIGAINVDETTHYLSPKILDRVHIMRFSSPLLDDWVEVEAEVEEFDLDLSLPVKFDIEALGVRSHYPEFDMSDNLVSFLVNIVREYLEPLGIEFGLRTIRQARNYSDAIKALGATDELVLNNIILHKVLPKLMFDGEKSVDENIYRKDILISMRDHLAEKLAGLDAESTVSCIDELDRVIRNARANDWVVNYWAR
ncbi:McrB family protein [Microbulbifer thermotolerans]|uniref:McrB family protein n=1 Tax=Microbulbifer thermotolerans TaxID=252514 RepID=UPI002248CD9D|nr:AAA family ATPase [Microbulbifer thermotolerans]MCX2781095.1 AAA family ATPase [Microbulbifer thermotolerans]MCX2804475.1 AAA family ATPase [Microbulbifer thermotolerans]MCX2831255.1 AAA family ATPase [Microbulbifer thermotolerans]